MVAEVQAFSAQLSGQPLVPAWFYLYPWSLARTIHFHLSYLQDLVPVQLYLHHWWLARTIHFHLSCLYNPLFLFSYISIAGGWRGSSISILASHTTPCSCLALPYRRRLVRTTNFSSQLPSQPLVLPSSTLPSQPLVLPSSTLPSQPLVLPAVSLSPLVNLLYQLTIQHISHTWLYLYCLCLLKSISQLPLHLLAWFNPSLSLTKLT